MSDYPEHERLRAVKPDAQACGGFVDWLEEQGYAICRLRDLPNGDGEYVLLGVTLEKLLAQHFGIDLDKLEAEKLAMLRTFNPDFGDGIEPGEPAA